MTLPSLETLIANARNTQMTAEERETQRLSFAFGNTHIENANITRDTVRRASKQIRDSQADGGSHDKPR